MFIYKYFAALLLLAYRMIFKGIRPEIGKSSLVGEWYHPEFRE